MRRYFGSSITAYGAILLPIFLVLPIVFAASLLLVEIDFAAIFIAIWCIVFSITCMVYIKQVSAQLYSWGQFGEDKIKIHIGFSRSFCLEYEKCKSIGIGMYTHGILNSSVGSKIYFIFFSYQPFDEKYRTTINLWKPSSTRIKVCFSKKLYEYLLTVLPRKHAMSLQHDYEKYVSPGSKRKKSEI